MFENIVRGSGEWIGGLKQVAPWITCCDGTTLSVQASSTHYCSPRRDYAPCYTHVEVGYLSCVPPAEWDEFDCGSDVYAQVPVGLVREFIEMHGGEV